MSMFDNYFPYPTMRKEQKNILEKLDKAFKANKRFIIIEAGTGIGKSAIAKAISGYSKSSYLLTATKQLQDQYENDFRNMNTKVVKGKANYPCVLDNEGELDCQNGLCKYRKTLIAQCGNDCPYARARNIAMSSEMCVCSYAYFLGFIASMRKQQKISDFVRPNIIIDEAHLLEDQLIQYSAITINRRKLMESYDFLRECDIKEQAMYMTRFKDEEANMLDKYIGWIQTTYDMLLRYFEKETFRLEELNEKPTTHLTPDELAELEESKNKSKILDKLEKMLGKLDYFLNSEQDNWIVSVEDENTLKIQPLSVDKLFKRYLNDVAKDNIIFLSATILNATSFCNDLGIDKSEACFIRQDGIFNVNRSPIVDDSVGNMSYKQLAKTMPLVYDEIKEILKRHKGQKGIIHTGNYSIMNNIIQNVKSKRFICRESRNNLQINNEEMLKLHTLSKKDTVLISPSLMAGVDLADDLARFQIIVKMPYISLADKRVKHKMSIDSDWYTCKMLRNLVQSCGRSTRSATDWSVTYILDNSFCNIVKRFGYLLPNNFKNRIVYNSQFNLVEFYNEVK